jgi:hypothetical protein
MTVRLRKVKEDWLLLLKWVVTVVVGLTTVGS